MPDLYIANPTVQGRDLFYRLPEKMEKVFQVYIAAGTQQRVLAGKTVGDVEAVIRVQAIYGMLSENEVKRADHFVPMIYSIDKPVDPGVMMVAQDKNLEVLTLRGFENRKTAGLAAFKGAQAEAERAPNSGAGELVEMETEVREDLRAGQREGLVQTTLVSPRQDQDKLRRRAKAV